MSNKVSLKGFPFLVPVKCKDLIRLGNNRDGGYVVSLKSVHETDYLISFGMGSNVTFEHDFMVQNRNVTTYCFDHSVAKPSLFRLLRMIVISIVCKNKLLMQDYFRLYNTCRKANFYHIQKRIVGSPRILQEISLKNIKDRITSNRIFFKIDIEGDEYDILEQLTEIKGEITGLVIEFHQTKEHIELIKGFIESINTEMVLIHFHANNFSRINDVGLADSVELSFAKRNFIESYDQVLTLPNEYLDAANAPNRMDYQVEI